MEDQRGTVDQRSDPIAGGGGKDGTLGVGIAGAGPVVYTGTDVLVDNRPLQAVGGFSRRIARFLSAVRFRTMRERGSVKYSDLKPLVFSLRSDASNRR